MHTDVVEVRVGEGADAVPRARRDITAALDDLDPSVLEDVRVVATELVTNARLHGRGTVIVRVLRLPAGARLEVHDGGAQMPVLTRQSTESMTGRGLALVARLSTSWGATPQAHGKVVWAELIASGEPDHDAAPQFDAGVDLDALLASLGDEAGEAGTSGEVGESGESGESEQVFTVELGSVPTELLLAAKAHVESVVREFQLEAAGDVDSGHRHGEPVPGDLAEAVATVVHDFAAARDAIKRQAVAAADRGDREVRLRLMLPLSAADAGERYLDALDQADLYARNARTLTLETPPVHQVFRRWYVSELVTSLRAAAAGVEAVPGPTFPELLGEALTELAPMRAQAERLEVLQTITAELTAAGTVDDVAQTVVRNAATLLGAYNATVYLLDHDGQLAVAAADGTFNTEMMRQYARFPVTPDTPGGVALLSGESVVCRDRADLVGRFPMLHDAFPYDTSLLVAPMIVGDHQLGVLSMTFSGQARIEEHAQRTFLVALAGLTAQALERATVAGAAALANERLAFLAQASMLLSSTLESGPVLEAIAELVVPATADWCSIQLLQDGALETAAVTHVDPDKVQWALELRDRYPADMDAPTGAPNVTRTGVSELYPYIPDELLAAAAQDEEHLQILRALGMTSALVVPLSGRTGILGVLTLISAESGRRYDQRDVEFAEDLARRAALAVENAHAYTEQSGKVAALTRVAEAAQHAILSPPPSRVGPVALAARYASAAADALVGGDLYAHVRRPGAVRLITGDVRGKGLDAVRTATIVLGEFRASAADLDDLADVAGAMDRRLRDYLEPEDFVTALLAEIRDDGTFTLACCGHPPPLLATPEGVDVVQVHPAVPLGLGPVPRVTTGRLEPGHRLLLYTDGILEARNPSREFVDLMDLVSPLRHGELDAALDAVVDRLTRAVGGVLGDDLALLIAEYQP